MKKFIWLCSKQAREDYIHRLQSCNRGVAWRRLGNCLLRMHSSECSYKIQVRFCYDARVPLFSVLVLQDHGGFREIVAEFIRDYDAFEKAFDHIHSMLAIDRAQE